MLAANSNCICRKTGSLVHSFVSHGKIIVEKKTNVKDEQVSIDETETADHDDDSQCFTDERIL